MPTAARTLLAMLGVAAVVGVAQVGSGSSARGAGQGIVDFHFVMAAVLYDHEENRPIGRAQPETATSWGRAGLDVVWRLPIVNGAPSTIGDKAYVLSAYGSMFRQSNFADQSCRGTFGFDPSRTNTFGNYGLPSRYQWQQPAANSGFVASKGLSPGSPCARFVFPCVFAGKDVHTQVRWTPNYPQPNSDCQHSVQFIFDINPRSPSGTHCAWFDLSGKDSGAIPETQHAVWFGRVTVTKNPPGLPPPTYPFTLGGYDGDAPFAPPLSPPSCSDIKNEPTSFQYVRQQWLDQLWLEIATNAILAQEAATLEETVENMPPPPASGTVDTTVTLSSSGGKFRLSDATPSSTLLATLHQSVRKGVRPRFRLRYTPQGLATLRGLKTPDKLTARIVFTQAGGKRTVLTKSAPVIPLGAGGGGSAPPPASSGRIASVQFSGNPANPSIAVRGTKLGSRPSPDPSGHPSGQMGCPVVSGDTGYDYGTSLYLADASKSWAAGRSRPSLGELDCIDLVVTKFTSTEVDYHFGPFYTKYEKGKLDPGDTVQVVVNGASKTVHVKYGAPVTG